MELVLPLPRCDDETSASYIRWKYLKQRCHGFCKADKKKANGVSLKNVFSKSLLIHLGGEEATKMVRDFFKRDVDSFQNLLESIEDLCLPRFILLYERFKFFTCKQTEEDDIGEFILEVKHLARYCEFQGHMDRYIQRRILNGVKDEEIRTKLQSKRNLMLTEVLDTCFEIKGRSLNVSGKDNSLKVTGKDKLLKVSGNDNSLKVSGKDNPLKVSGKDKLLKLLGKEKQVRGEKSAGPMKTISQKGSNNGVCELSPSNNQVVLKRGSHVDKSTTKMSAIKPRKTRKEQTDYLGLLNMGFHESSLNSAPKDLRTVRSVTKLRKFLRSHSKVVTSKVGESLAMSAVDESLATSAVGESLAKNTLKGESKDCLVETTIEKSSAALEGVNQTELNGADKHAALGFIPEDVMYDFSMTVPAENPHLKNQLKQDERTLDFFDEEVAKFDCEVSGNDNDSGSQDVDSTSHKADSGLMSRSSKTCPICGVSCTSAYVMKCHMSTHSGQRFYKCDICDAGFIHSGSRSRHMRLMHPELLKLKCEECGMLFELQTALDQHKLSHSKQVEMTCDDCGETFKTTREHFQHRRKEHRNIRYSCEKCGLHFPYPSKLKLHLMSKHNATKPFMCEICGSSFAEQNMLTNHKNIHSGEKKHECTTCGRRFLLKTTLKNHIQTHLDRKPHCCGICGMGFKLSYYLKSHLKIHEESRERPHICSTCGAAFLKSAQLRNHERKHTGEKPFKCEVCNAVFSQLSSMKKHIKQIHEGVKPKDRFSCEFCGQSFTHSCKLKLHLMKHTGERPFTCKICNSTYREKHQLTSHMKVHSGDEPFKCPICGRRFLQKSYMEGHMRKHSGEKPFKCTICDAGFTQKGYLRDHVKVHDQNRERKYKCSVCCKAFTCSSHMRSHEKLHSGEKPHRCDVCGSKFTKRSSLKKHLKRTHSLQSTSSSLGQSPAMQTLEDATLIAISQLPCGLQAELQCGSYLQATSQQPVETEVIANVSEHLSQEVHPSKEYQSNQQMLQIKNDMRNNSQLHHLSPAMQSVHLAPVQQLTSMHTALAAQLQLPAHVLTDMHTHLHTAVQQSEVAAGLHIYTVPS